MTLADFVRKYLEERRKVCEEKARFSNFGRDVLYFSKEGENTSSSSSESSNSKYFSNTLEKKPKPQKDTCVNCKKIQTSKTVKVTRRPDGKIETETTIKDSEGNIEKTISYQDGDTVYTTVTKTDPSGRTQVKHNVKREGHPDENSNDSLVPVIDQFVPKSNSDDDYDFWFNKFFGKPKPAPEFFTRENGDKKDSTMQDFDVTDKVMQEAMPFDFNNVEDNISKLLKMFENDFPSSFKSQSFAEDFSPKTDDAPKFFEQFENETQKPAPKNGKTHGRTKKGDRDLQSQVDSIMKNFLSPKTAGLFEQFADRAIVEVPDEKTPLDKFIELDEETQKKRLSILQERNEVMKRLNSYFDRKLTIDDGKQDVYSDIEPVNDDEIALFVPQPQPNPTPNLNDFSQMLAKQFGPFSGINFNITTKSKMKFPNGNLRTETVKKDKNGNFEKSITYEAGNKVYTLITVTTPSGQQIDRQRKLNFSENELSNFKKQWDARYQSDFSD
ncbi:uncharacterized protein LOC135837028 [Planococcus citri]|uniref:uncharacterized protein LOC135837028 n=1 Tax=Planococcus citri TaxID=170843 RepID=UPI0031F9168A